MATRANKKAIPVMTAEVLIDSVGLSRVFTYLVPERFLTTIGIGSYVSVKLGHSRARGWTVGLKVHDDNYLESCEFVLSPIFRLLGGGPNPEIIALCKWASWRFIGSPVNFLTHASPKKRISSRAGGELEFGVCEEQIRSSRGESLVVRIPPSHSRINWLIEHLGSPLTKESQTIVVCATQRVVQVVARTLQSLGFDVALFPEEFEKARDIAQVIVGARNASFASVSNLAEIIVIDADEPSHSETSSPIWNSFEVARARVDHGQIAIALSSVPSLGMISGSRVLALNPSDERQGWPKVLVRDISEGDQRHSLISSELVSLINSVLENTVQTNTLDENELINYDGVIVLYNRLGGARTLLCSQCGQAVACVKCGGTLMQINPLINTTGILTRGGINERAKKMLKVDGLICPRCKEEYPAICTHCLSTSVKVVSFGIKRFSALLGAATGKSVTEVNASSDIPGDAFGAIVVGTEAIFSRFARARMVVIADFDHYLFAPSLDASEKALALLARAARLVPSRSVKTDYVPIYIQTRDIGNPVFKAAIEGDQRERTAAEFALRKRLGLPPYGAIVRVSGAKASSWVRNSAIGDDPNLEVIDSGDGFDVRSGSKEALLDAFYTARQKVSSSGVRFVVDSG